MPPVIWLNGPFGVGKTHTAYALHARLQNSFVFDPEELGYALRRLTPPHARQADFQDHPLWVPFVVEALSEAARVARGPVIVPMTLSDPSRHAALIGGLRGHGLDVHHFTLLVLFYPAGSLPCWLRPLRCAQGCAGALKKRSRGQEGKLKIACVPSPRRNLASISIPLEKRWTNSLRTLPPPSDSPSSCPPNRPGGVGGA